MKDTYAVSFSTDKSVNAVAPAINGNREALVELQQLVDLLTERVEKLEPITDEWGWPVGDV